MHSSTSIEAITLLPKLRKYLRISIKPELKHDTQTLFEPSPNWDEEIHDLSDNRVVTYQSGVVLTP